MRMCCVSKSYVTIEVMDEFVWMSHDSRRTSESVVYICTLSFFYMCTYSTACKIKGE